MSARSSHAQPAGQGDPTKGAVLPAKVVPGLSWGAGPGDWEIRGARGVPGRWNRTICLSRRKDPSPAFSPGCPVGRACPGAVGSDLDHLEILLGVPTFRARPVGGHIHPPRPPGNGLFRKSHFFLVEPSANRAHPAFVFHGVLFVFDRWWIQRTYRGCIRSRSVCAMAVMVFASTRSRFDVMRQESRWTSRRGDTSRPGHPPAAERECRRGWGRPPTRHTCPNSAHPGRLSSSMPTGRKPRKHDDPAGGAIRSSDLALLPDAYAMPFVQFCEFIPTGCRALGSDVFSRSLERGLSVGLLLPGRPFFVNVVQDRRRRLPAAVVRRTRTPCSIRGSWSVPARVTMRSGVVDAGDGGQVKSVVHERSWGRR